MRMDRLWRGPVWCLALAISGISAQAQPSRASSAIQPEVWRIVLLANQSRAQAGAAPLKWDASLAMAARQHCLRMAAEGPLSHQYAGEPDVSMRASHAGAHFSLIEENVAIAPDPDAIHDAWMHSPPHRENLLNPDVDRVGVAVVASRRGIYAVADYERIVPVLTRTQVETAVAGRLRSRGVAVLGDASVARAACMTNRGLPRAQSGAQPRFVMRWQEADLSRLPQTLVDNVATGQYRAAAVGSCPTQGHEGAFTAFRVAVLLY